MATLAVFARRMDRLATQVEAAVLTYQGEIFVEISREVIRRTPVDTGLARGNWQSSAGVGQRLQIARLSPLGDRSIREAEVMVRRAPLGVPMFLTNNVDYIGRLNQGSSPQAPSAFIEQGVGAGAARAIARRRRLL